MKRGSSAQMIEFTPSFAYRGTEGQSETHAKKRRKTMSKYNKDDIIRLVEEEDVEFIRLQFTEKRSHHRQSVAESTGESMHVRRFRN